MPLVSVIIPSYNHERFISEAIESVLNQTFTDFELIIIDDASKDKSKEIIKAHEEKDSRIRAFFHEENKGIARTMNEGIEEADGKFIALFASDDLWVSSKLEKQLEVLKEDENMVVWSEGLVIDARGNPTGETFTQKHGASKRKKSDDILEELLKGNYICGQSVILKRENLVDIKHDEHLKYLNDYKLMVDLASRYKYYFIQEPLVRYRIHGRNTISDKNGYLNDTIIIGKYFLEKYGDTVSDNTKGYLFSMIINTYLSCDEKAKAAQYIYHAIKIDLIDSSNLRDVIAGKEAQVAQLQEQTQQKDAQIVQLQEEINKLLQLKSLRLHQKIEEVLRKLRIR